MEYPELYELAKLSIHYMRSIMGEDDSTATQIEEVFSEDELLTGTMVINTLLMEYISEKEGISESDILSIVEQKINKS